MSPNIKMRAVALVMSAPLVLVQPAARGGRYYTTVRRPPPRLATKSLLISPNHVQSREPDGGRRVLRFVLFLGLFSMAPFAIGCNDSGNDGAAGSGGTGGSGGTHWSLRASQARTSSIATSTGPLTAMVRSAGAPRSTRLARSVAPKPAATRSATGAGSCARRNARTGAAIRSATTGPVVSSPVTAAAASRSARTTTPAATRPATVATARASAGQGRKRDGPRYHSHEARLART